MRLRTNDLQNPIHVWCFENDRENCDDREEETHSSLQFQNDDKVQINIQKTCVVCGCGVHARCRKWKVLSRNNQ